MNRKFGIELEIVSINRQTALRALRAVGINVQDENYNHTTRGHWKLVSDASVHGGFEVVSPILRGEQGIEEAMTVAAAITVAANCSLVSPVWSTRGAILPWALFSASTIRITSFARPVVARASLSALTTA